MRIVLFDQISGGHHTTYAINLIENLILRGHTILFIGPDKLIEPINNAIKSEEIEYYRLGDFQNPLSEFKKMKLAIEVLIKSNKFNADIVHFLYIDRNILSLIAICRMRGIERLRVTLHWAYFLKSFSPSFLGQIRGNLEVRILSYFSQRGMRIIVHSKTLKSEINNLMRIDASDYVPYPVDIVDVTDTERALLREGARQSLNVAPDDHLILIFGGTRLDKGADLAIDALNELPTNYRMIIAGEPQHFSEEYLRSREVVGPVGSRIHFIAGHIPESEVNSLFLASDMILLPYRKFFAGQSGPLTIAASLGIPVVAADVAVLRETIEEYSLGLFFTSENVNLMAQAILKTTDEKYSSVNGNFVHDHSSANFTGAVLESYMLTTPRNS